MRHMRELFSPYEIRRDSISAMWLVVRTLCRKMLWSVRFPYFHAIFFPFFSNVRNTGNIFHVSFSNNFAIFWFLFSNYFFFDSIVNATEDCKHEVLRSFRNQEILSHRKCWQEIHCCSNWVSLFTSMQNYHLLLELFVQFIHSIIEST